MIALRHPLELAGLEATVTLLPGMRTVAAGPSMIGIQSGCEERQGVPWVLASTLPRFSAMVSDNSLFGTSLFLM
ncbi:hypothetical protein K469DRAFT_717353 [Zopfia rhizophila CBS 207.26]|uniref:Uncharacterized protein n=1 Tax=Zopfia rhizophila CBS 207.26 TaxID=1314779 RepID=A0A6A6EP55_9PEZI|nr:hypothetical protein K469DRAFT_717353 [Zopfia rhizophila CBS 207.26]